MQLKHETTESTTAPLATVASHQITEDAPVHVSHPAESIPGRKPRTLRSRIADWILPHRWVRDLARKNSADVTPQEVERLITLLKDPGVGMSEGHLSAIRLLGTVVVTDELRSRAAAACARQLNSYSSGEPDVSFSFWAWVGILGTIPLSIGIHYALRAAGNSGAWVPSTIEIEAWLIMTIMILSVPLWVIYASHQWKKMRVAYAGALGQMKSPAGVEPLLTACTSSTAPLRAVSEKALQTLVASLTPESCAELSGPSQQICCTLLRSSNEGLALALLDLLEHGGDGDACRYVAELAGATSSALVRERAAAVLPILEERRREAQKSAHRLTNASFAEKHLAAIRRTSAGLFPNNWIRRIARGDLTNPALADIDRLVHLVCDKSPGTNRAYRTAVLLLGAVPLTGEQRRRVVDACRLWVNSGFTGNVTGCLGRWAAAAGLLGVITAGLNGGYDAVLSGVEHLGVLGSTIWYVIFLTLVLPLLMPYETHRWNKTRAVLARTLGQIRSPDGVETLLTAAGSSLPGVRAAGEGALESLLASLTPESYPEISSFSQQDCCHLLGRNNDRLALALLDLLEHRGDGSAYRSVATLARRSKSERVRARATAVLPILEERREAAKNVVLLLRASSAGASPDTLLRAGQATEIRPEELLRASDGETPHA